MTPTPGQPLSEADVQNGWIAHDGGQNPVPGMMIDWRSRDGVSHSCFSDDLHGWKHPHESGPKYDIIAYRPHVPFSRPGDGVSSAAFDVFEGLCAKLDEMQPCSSDDIRAHFARGTGGIGPVESMIDAIISALTPPAEPVSRPAGEGETTQHTPRCWGRTSYSDEMAHCYCKPAGEGEREAVAILKGVGKINGDGWKDTTTKGEVVFVWNAEKPSPYAPGQYPRIGNEGWSASTSQYDFTPATADDVPAIIALLSPAAPDAGGGGEEDIMRTQEDWSALLYGRDSFIVRKGLWSEFVDSLPALQPGGER